MVTMILAVVCLVSGSGPHTPLKTVWSPTVSPDELKVLLDERPELLNQADSGGTLLMYHMVEGRLEVVKMLIARGANVNAVNENGMSALHFAAISCLPEHAKALIDAGASLTAVDKWGRTPLHVAPRVAQA